MNTVCLSLMTTLRKYYSGTDIYLKTWLPSQPPKMFWVLLDAGFSYASWCLSILKIEATEVSS